MIEKIRVWAQKLKRNVITLCFACKHPRTPVLAKAIAVFTVGYALSPIDLIPDFIPVLGYLDDLIILPALIWLALQLTPHDVIAECEREADAGTAQGAAKPRSIFGAMVIVATWFAFAIWLWLSFGREWMPV